MGCGVWCVVSSGGDKGGLGRGLAVMPPSCGNGCEKCAELNVLTWFVDRFITCTLKDPSTRQQALDLQQHKHFPQSCRKRGTNCGMELRGFLLLGLLFRFRLG